MRITNRYNRTRVLSWLRDDIHHAVIDISIKPNHNRFYCMLIDMQYQGAWPFGIDIIVDAVIDC